MPDRAPHTRIPHEALASLRHRLETLPARHPDRKGLVANAAALYGLSRATLYRGLRHQVRPKPLHRSDRGKPKIIAPPELERYCETIAAMKLRTMNGKGRHLSTAAGDSDPGGSWGRDAGGTGAADAGAAQQGDR